MTTFISCRQQPAPVNLRWSEAAGPPRAQQLVTCGDRRREGSGKVVVRPPPPQRLLCHCSFVLLWAVLLLCAGWGCSTLPKNSRKHSLAIHYDRFLQEPGRRRINESRRNNSNPCCTRSEKLSHNEASSLISDLLVRKILLISMMLKLIPKRTSVNVCQVFFLIGATCHQWKFGQSHNKHFYQPCTIHSCKSLRWWVLNRIPNLRTIGPPRRLPIYTGGLIFRCESGTSEQCTCERADSFHSWQTQSPFLVGTYIANLNTIGPIAAEI